MSTTSLTPKGDGRSSSFIRMGLLALCIGVAVCGYVIIPLRGLFFGIAFNPTHAVPGSFQQELGEGEYLLSVQTSSSSSAGPITLSRGREVEASQVVVVDPAGTALDIRSGRNQSVDRNGDRFAGVVVFQVTEPGVHQFQVATATETNALVIESAPAFSLRSFGLAAMGSAVVSLGALLCVIGAVRRGRPAAPSMPPPPFP